MSTLLIMFANVSEYLRQILPTRQYQNINIGPGHSRGWILNTKLTSSYLVPSANIAKTPAPVRNTMFVPCKGLSMNLNLPESGLPSNPHVYNLIGTPFPRLPNLPLIVCSRYCRRPLLYQMYSLRVPEMLLSVNMLTHTVRCSRIF